MAGLPEFLYSDRTESEVALIAPVADADGERAHMSSLTDEAGSDGLEGEFGDAVLRRERSAFPLGTASQSRPPKSTVNTVAGDYVCYAPNMKRTKWEEAALYVQEGEDNDKFFHHPMGKWSKMAYTILHNPVFHVADLLVSILLMALSLIEKPTFYEHVHEEHSTTVIIHSVLEIVLLTLLAIDIILRLIWLRPYYFIRHKRTVAISIVLVVMFVEVFVVVGHQKSHFRITRALRPMFFIDTYLMFGVRRVLRQVFKSLKPIIDVLLLLLFTIAFFALIGYFLFAADNKDYFESFPMSYVSLFIALTTANHPDVMMEAYRRHRVSAIFFIIYVTITVYFVSNVLLAVVYSTFCDEEKKKFKKLFLHKREALLHAYNVLAGPTGIEFHDFLLFMQIYKPCMPEWQVMCIFKVLHGNADEAHGNLNLEEFYSFYEFRNFKWHQVTAEGESLVWFANFQPKFKRPLQAIRDLVLSRCFNPIIYALVLINILFLIIYALTIDSNDLDDRFEKLRIVLPVSFFFVIIYTIEIGLRLTGLGPTEYFRKFWNKVDFIMIVVSWLALGLEVNPAFQILAVIRPVKVARILRLKRRYRDIMNTLVILTPRLLSVGLLLFVIYYMFAIIGMEFLQGEVSKGCCGSAWYGAGQYYVGSTDGNQTTNVYYLNNFNSILESYVTLFILMVVNNWYIIMEGFASEAGWLARVYFMSFYVITLVVLNVVISFIVDAFVLNIQTTERRRVRRKFRPQDQGHDSIHDESAFALGTASQSGPPKSTVNMDDIRKKEVEVFLVDADINKLRYEITYHDEAKRDRRASFNILLRRFRRVEFHRIQAPLKYSGRRLRTKDDLHLLMYREELPLWVEEQEKIQQEQENIQQEQEKIQAEENMQAAAEGIENSTPHKRWWKKLGDIALQIPYKRWWKKLGDIALQILEYILE